MSNLSFWLCVLQLTVRLPPHFSIRLHRSIDWAREGERSWKKNKLRNTMLDTIPPRQRDFNHTQVLCFAPKKRRKIERKTCGFSAHLFQQINLSYWGLIWEAIYFTLKELLLSNFACWHLRPVCVCVCVCLLVLSMSFRKPPNFSPLKFSLMVLSALLLL